MFVTINTKPLSQQNYVCHGKIFLSQQTHVCHDKRFVTTSILLLWQKMYCDKFCHKFCHDENMLWQAYFCHNKRHVCCDKNYTCGMQLLPMLQVRMVSDNLGLYRQGLSHTPSIAFRHLPPNSARFSYATKGALYLHAAVQQHGQCPPKGLVLIWLWKQPTAKACT